MGKAFVMPRAEGDSFFMQNTLPLPKKSFLEALQ
jgi:hypothetical protein